LPGGGRADTIVRLSVDEGRPDPEARMRERATNEDATPVRGGGGDRAKSAESRRAYPGVELRELGRIEPKLQIGSELPPPPPP
jgi:hypothetical protein